MRCAACIRLAQHQQAATSVNTCTHPTSNSYIPAQRLSQLAAPPALSTCILQRRSPPSCSFRSAHALSPAPTSSADSLANSALTASQHPSLSTTARANPAPRSNTSCGVRSRTFFLVASAARPRCLPPALRGEEALRRHGHARPRSRDVAALPS